jgi:hypothetical protein
VTGLFGCFFDSSTATEHNQIGQRDFFAGLRTVELLLDLLEFTVAPSPASG